MYAAVSLVDWANPVRSQSGLGVAGVLLVAITVAAGLGFCALIGIAFNASTTQIVPFLALGLGVDNMFLLTHTYAQSWDADLPPDEHVGEILKRSGVSILLSSLSNACAFFAAAIIPIPALRAFSLQAGILVLFNVSTLLLVFPAIMSLDTKRRNANRVDLLCCLAGESSESAPRSNGVGAAAQGGEQSPQSQHKEPPVGAQRHPAPVVRAAPGCVTPTLVKKTPVSSPPPPTTTTPPPPTPTPTSAASKDAESAGGCVEPLLVAAGRSRGRGDRSSECSGSWTLSRMARDWYGRLVTRTPVKVIGVVAYIVLVGGALWSASKVKNGLNLTDVVPHQTAEYGFLAAHDKYFGFYNMYAVTQGNFEYPNNQRLLYEYHDAFMRVSNIIKNDDGGLPEFWLSLFRDWLISLQKAFDRDYAAGCINEERWFSNASDDGILAYKLLVQTGHVDNPIDKSLVTQVRLVDGDGIIQPKAFYNYLTAWVSNDALAYSASQSSLRPEPRLWYHNAADVELKIPKSPPLVYAQLPFYLNNLGETEDITETIEQVRAVCKKFEERGLPNFPAGIPFTFWEQYLKLRFFLFLALACVLVAIFLVLCLTLMSIWAAALIVLVLAAMVVQLFGVLGLLGIKLSAAPAVILIMAVGVGVDFTLHVLVGFVTSIGGRNRRTHLAIELMFAPVVHGAVSTLLSIAMLAFSDFDFIVQYVPTRSLLGFSSHQSLPPSSQYQFPRHSNPSLQSHFPMATTDTTLFVHRYFFYVLSALVVLGLVNGLFFLPILLSLVGPPAELVPLDGQDRIAPPTPEPSPLVERSAKAQAKVRVLDGQHGGHNGGGHGCHNAGHHGAGSGGSNGASVNYVPRRLRGSDLSLTTITEEPPSWTSSHEIVVQPEVVVETTTCNGNGACSSSRHSSSSSDQVTFSFTTESERFAPWPRPR